MKTFARCLALASILWSGVLSAEEVDVAVVPSVAAVKINRSDAPVINGVLDDEVWMQATPVKNLIQVEPQEGSAPSQDTEIYFLYDEKTLYVGAYLYEEDLSQIRATQLMRDARLSFDDSIQIYIDSNNTFRDSYLFALMPTGARVDALIENNNSFLNEWDTIWRGDAKITNKGWVAEFAIPFHSISFDPNAKEWNLQIVRVMRRNNEELRWANINRSLRTFDVSETGRLRGVTSVEKGLGLEAQLFAAGSASFDHVNGDDDYEIHPSGNAFYKITESLTASLTVNTDFSDARLDERQVNTGRFSLFFPETREFFLQDIAVFEFGRGVFDDLENGMPLFTRRIGIVDGTPVDLLAGGKISGKQGPFSIGALATVTGEEDVIGLDQQFLGATRISAAVLGESKAGIVFTNGNPDGSTDNTVAGVDFQYQNSSLIGEGVVRADIAYLSTSNDGAKGDLVGAALEYSGNKWGANLTMREIDEGYAPALGFANRTGIREIYSSVRREWRPALDFVRTFTARASYDQVSDLDNDLEDRFVSGWFEVENDQGDEISVDIENGFLSIKEPFEIAGVVPVQVGDYHFNQYGIEVTTSSTRSFAVSVEYEGGAIYDGDYQGYSGEIRWRPNKHLTFEVDYSSKTFSLPSGEVEVDVYSAESIVAFNPNMFIVSELQYDNISENFSVFSRFTWEPRPEQQIFLSLGHSATADQNEFFRSFEKQGTSFGVRLGHSFRL